MGPILVSALKIVEQAVKNHLSILQTALKQKLFINLIYLKKYEVSQELMNEVKSLVENFRNDNKLFELTDEKILTEMEYQLIQYTSH